MRLETEQLTPHARRALAIVTEGCESACRLGVVALGIVFDRCDPDRPYSISYAMPVADISQVKVLLRKALEHLEKCEPCVPDGGDSRSSDYRAVKRMFREGIPQADES